MSKKGKGYNDFSELSGRTVFVTPGSAYWEFIKKKYKLTNVKELAYFGDITAFLANDNAIAQSYSTNEPFALSQKGIDTEFKFAYESGFNPYDSVLFTTEAFLKDHPDVVKAYVAATVKGWDFYKGKYMDVNDYILKNNPNGTKEGFKFASEKQNDLMYIDDALTKGFGYMSKERWSALQDQMLDLAIIKNKVNIDTLFTIDYLPKSAK
jgi:NitT/TauT family transport system substrate-binding protein